MNRLTIPIRGMHCGSCEVLIAQELKKIPGAHAVSVSHKHSRAEIGYANTRPADEQIIRAVRAAGYEVGTAPRLPWISRSAKDYGDLGKATILVALLYGVARWLGLFDLTVGAQPTGFMVALFVGLVAGVSTCMALIGGMVLSLSAEYAKRHPESTAIQKFRPHVYFNVGRILGYVLFGGLIGLIGQAIKPSASMVALLTLLAGIVMIFFGLKLIEIFPVLRTVTIALPSRLAGMVDIGGQAKEYSRKNAAAMGALTFFLPCGFTQAMQLYAVSSGSFISGAMIMGLFALGTALGLLGIGGFTALVKGRMARFSFMGVGLSVLLLGWTHLGNGGRMLHGAIFSVDSATASTASQFQEIRMTQTNRGYQPTVFTVERGRPVKWTINSASPFSCASSLAVPQLGINKTLNRGDNVITFTPSNVGYIDFSCSMGMYRGRIIVVDPPQQNSTYAK